MMKFELNQRVLVGKIDIGGGGMVCKFHPNSPLPGTVVRIRSDGGAWVRLDARLADETLHPFPDDDPRANHVLTYPKWCLPHGCSYE
jgi:hypothetical protein